jgi:hypothetical protein
MGGRGYLDVVAELFKRDFDAGDGPSRLWSTLPRAHGHTTPRRVLRPSMVRCHHARLRLACAELGFRRRALRSRGLGTGPCARLNRRY